MNLSVKVYEWQEQAVEKLTKAGIKSAHLDALVLLEDELGTNRAHLLAHPEMRITSGHVTKLAIKLRRRVTREPLAYIRGHVEFYGRDFGVNKHVLIPRPESESFISMLLEKHIYFETLLDIGTGSGVLGITAKLELPHINVTLSDTSKHALNVARKNAKSLDASVTLKQQDLLPSINNYNVLFANLPYIPIDMTVDQDILYEPNSALFSGKDGLDHYRLLWYQIGTNSNKSTFVFTESLLTQHQKMIELAEHAGYTQDQANGLVQLFSLQA